MTSVQPLTQGGDSMNRAQDKPCDYAVILSGPRDTGPGRKKRRKDIPRDRNANYGRMRPGVLIAQKFKVPLLVSGYLEERPLLERELATVCREFGITGLDVQFCDKARHTAGNAAYSLGRARERFGFDRLDPDGPYVPRRIAVATHKWHRPRAELLFRGVQQLLARYCRRWARSVPFQFEFVDAPSDDLDEDFWKPYAKAELAKFAADRARLERWMRSELGDAPTILQRAVENEQDRFGLDDLSSEHDLATAILDLTLQSAPIDPQEAVELDHGLTRLGLANIV